jgi:hypothetical protein
MYWVAEVVKQIGTQSVDVYTRNFVSQLKEGGKIEGIIAEPRFVFGFLPTLGFVKSENWHTA